MTGEKTENNRTDQEVSEEYRKQTEKKLKKMKMISLETWVTFYADVLMNNTHKTYIKLIQSRSGRIEECQEGILWILMLHTYKWQNLIKRSI